MPNTQTMPKSDTAMAHAFKRAGGRVEIAKSDQQRVLNRLAEIAKRHGRGKSEAAMDEMWIEAQHDPAMLLAATTEEQRRAMRVSLMRLGYAAANLDRPAPEETPDETKSDAKSEPREPDPATYQRSPAQTAKPKQSAAQKHEANRRRSLELGYLEDELKSNGTPKPGAQSARDARQVAAVTPWVRRFTVAKMLLEDICVASYDSVATQFERETWVSAHDAALLRALNVKAKAVGYIPEGAKTFDVFNEQTVEDVILEIAGSPMSIGNAPPERLPSPWRNVINKAMARAT